MPDLGTLGLLIGESIVLLIESLTSFFILFSVSNVDLEKSCAEGLVPAPEREKVTLGLDLFPSVVCHYQKMKINGVLNRI